MRRREFLGVLGGAAAWPLTLHAQQRSERVRRVGVLNTLPSQDAYGQERIGAFLQGLQQAGWSIDGNLRVDQRWWNRTDPDVMRGLAAELIALEPDVILATGGVAVRPLAQATRTVPIVFCNVPDPVGAGFVQSLARPGGNLTGFTQFEYSMSVKWLELLKEVAPVIRHIAVLRDQDQPSGMGQFGALQGAASTFGVELIPLGVRDGPSIEHGVDGLARSPNTGLIVTTGGLTTTYRKLIVQSVARNKLPAVYPARFFVDEGGLLSYGPDRVEPYRRAATYVDRILKGELPADLPVQAPTNFELTINLKTAKRLGLTLAPSLLARADEVIE